MLAALLAAVLLRTPGFDPSALRSGDIVIHTSQSAQGLAIALATGSAYTHVGLVEQTDGGLLVIEAVQPVRRTSLDEFVRRGAGGAVTALRYPGLDPTARAAVVQAAERLIGRPYDLAFAPGDREIYCSELIHLAYAAAGLRIGRWSTLGELRLDAAPVRKLLAQRWRRHPACRGARSLHACEEALSHAPVLTPRGLREDPRLLLVGTSFPVGTR